MAVKNKAIGLVGKKCGMTRIFTKEGEHIPITVISIDNNRITQLKTEEIDGYSAVQITCGAKKSSRLSKPKAGHFAKANTESGEGLWEFRVDASSDLKPGDSLDVSQFESGQLVDITGVSKGKGFQGVVKRYNFSTQDASHGNSLSHRAPGSIGQCQTPGRVFKGKKMAGHMGGRKTTTQSLEIVTVDLEKGLLLVKGAVPGANNGFVIVKPALKAVNSGA